MKRLLKKRSRMLTILVLVWPAAVGELLSACGTIDINHGTSPPPTPRAFRDSGGWVVDGLHVTGRPVTVDIATYRLVVTGNVRNELSLRFDEIRAMPAVREEMRLVCPGMFADEGKWTGVRLREILEKAGVRSDSTRVVFTSIEGRYRQELPLARALADGVLISYEFEGQTFDRLNGFPLRLVAKNEAGYVWVKWLGRIEVVK